MSDTKVEQLARVEDDRHDVPIADDPDNPWYGIPAELVARAGHSYDLDTTGGCG
jgi:hypothetical protein